MEIDKLKQLVGSSNNIVFFGGAGVSTESNIPDFRSANGLYNEKNNKSYAPEQILSHTFFNRHTDEFFEFYREKMIYKDAKPNAAHIALAQLEKIGKLKAVVTQNIDGLHQMAGSKNVLELHGSIHRNYCARCGKFFNLDHILDTEGIPKCDECGGIIKPDVVLYEEALDMNTMNKATLAISEADILIIGGTSLTVYPAAGLINYYRGNKLILINKAETPQDGRANLVFHDSIGKILKQVSEIN